MKTRIVSLQHYINIQAVEHQTHAEQFPQASVVALPSSPKPLHGWVLCFFPKCSSGHQHKQGH
ncbi:UNVERIFIED_CONTAM: hypothetical protein K2H54_056766, partial [Gekko kuhli]